MSKVIIIGAGIAGLSAGVYALKNGFDATIYEKNDAPGGGARFIERDGCRFDSGERFVWGTQETSPLYKLWRDTGALGDGVSVDIPNPVMVSTYGKHTVFFYRDPDKLKDHLVNVSHGDYGFICDLHRDIADFSELRDSAPGLNDGARPQGGLFRKKKGPKRSRIAELDSSSAYAYAGQFENPAIKLALENILPPGHTAKALVTALARFAAGDGGIPDGGVDGMAKRMAEKFVSLGGKLEYGAGVQSVLYDNGKVSGVVVNGEAVESDAVIIASDALTAVDRLFDPLLAEPWAMALRESRKLSAGTLICFDIDTDLIALPERYIFPLPKPFIFAGETIRSLLLENYAGYPGRAPDGRTALTVTVYGDTWSYWKGARDLGLYDERKKELAELVTHRLTFKFQALRGKVLSYNVVTPLDYEADCGIYHGSCMAAEPGAANSCPVKPEGTKGLYFAGHRILPSAGLAGAVTSGKLAAEWMREDSQKKTG